MAMVYNCNGADKLPMVTAHGNETRFHDAYLAIECAVRYF